MPVCCIRLHLSARHVETIDGADIDLIIFNPFFEGASLIEKDSQFPNGWIRSRRRESRRERSGIWGDIVGGQSFYSAPSGDY
eukprot:scaffold10585_cov115-Skeletonema_menzelii.AAC.1